MEESKEEKPQTSNRSKMKFEHLPSNIRPINYRIHLKPDLINLTFSGEVEVTLSVRDKTNKIVCHAKNLEIQSVNITRGTTMFCPDNVELDQVTETVTLTLAKKLKRGRVLVNYKFSGQINDKMNGLYRFKYDHHGETRYGAVTQFQSTYARQAFPCWDEPALKATFDISVTGPSSRVILSNMPEANSREEKDGHLKTITFQTTPVMSSYLVAIAIGDFDYVEGTNKEGTIVRVFTPVGKKENGRHALACAMAALSFYSSFFGIPYPLEKYDMIAIPDFSMGAMENWGLVTYRESCLLADPLNSSLSAIQFISIIVCHETAHQWFGNLVTMEWWTDLWLNEGFASFMENLTADALYPEYKLWDQFIPRVMMEAMELDSLKSSHPIRIEVGHPSEVNAIFDKISYNKGCSVIRMLYNWIGLENFRNGLSNYLSKYAYENTRTSHLWEELERASNLPVRLVMKSWTDQMGFPLVSVTSRQTGRNKQNRILTLTQSKFTANSPNDDSRAKWKIPISIIHQGCVRVSTVILENKTMEVRLNNVKETDWVKLNPHVIGFYRVKYEESDLALFRQAIETKSLSHLDRLNIIDDLFNLIIEGVTPISVGLQLLTAYKGEDNYAVWKTISQAVMKLHNIVYGEAWYNVFAEYIRDIFSNIRKYVNWDHRPGESHVEILLRNEVIAVLGLFGDEAILAEAKKRFDGHIKGEKFLEPDLRSVVYRCVAYSGNDADFDIMVKLMMETDISEEKNRICRSGLANFRKKELVQKALDISISSSVRAQDCVLFIGQIANNPLGKDTVFNFFQNNYALFYDRYSTGSLITRLIKYVCESCREGDVVDRFFGQHKIPGTERTVAQALETIRINSTWKVRDASAIKEFVEAKNLH